MILPETHRRRSYDFRRKKYNWNKIGIFILIAFIFVTIVWAENISNATKSMKKFISSGNNNTPNNFSSVILNKLSFLSKSGFSCKAKLDESIIKSKARDPSIKISILEKKSFTNLDDAIEFIEYWGAENSRNSVKFARSQFTSNNGSVDIALIRVSSMICIDGCIETERLRNGICNSENKIIYPEDSFCYAGLCMD